MSKLVAVMEQMGRRLLCAPYFSSVCLGANALLVAAGNEQQQRWLPTIADGSCRATLAWCDASGRWDASGVSATFVRDGDGYVLDGEYRYVVDGHGADLLIVAARTPGSGGAQGIALFAVPADAAGVQRSLLPTLDQTRKLAAIRLERMRVPATALLDAAGEEAGAALAKILGLATVALAAEQAGGAQQILDIAVAYTKERQQFGRTIASFQAIKHKAADMMLKAEAARSAVYYAACVAQEALAGGAAVRANWPRLPAWPRRTAAKPISSTQVPRCSCTVAWASPGSTTCTCTSSARAPARVSSATRPNTVKRIAVELGL
jgi:alkylation response protein AidB-like acyl-CoA dehydrogenase